MEVLEENQTVCIICKTAIFNKDPTDELIDRALFKSFKMIFPTNINAMKVPEIIFCIRCRKAVEIASRFRSNCLRNLPAVTDHSYESQPEAKRLCIRKNREMSTQTGLSEYVIIVNHLPDEICAADVLELFSKYGPVENLFGNRKIPFCETFLHFTLIDESRISEISEQAARGEIRYKEKPLIVTVLPTNVAPINKLPANCLQQIFEKITSFEEKLVLEIVCKHWQKIARQSWSRVTSLEWLDFNSPFCRNNRHLFGCVVARCGAYLKDIQLNFMNPAMHYLGVISRYCTNLKNVKLDFEVGSSFVHCLPHIKKMIRMSSELQRLYIAHSGSGVDDLSDIIDELPPTMRELRLCDVTMTLNVSKLKNLMALSLSSLSFAQITLNGLEKLHNLEYLSLSSLRINRNCLEKIKFLTELRVFKVVNCDIDDRTLCRVLQYTRKLHHLDITGNNLLTDRSLYYVAQLPNLRSLVMNNLPGVTGAYLIQMPALEDLCCNNCPNMKDLNLIFTIDSCSKLIQLQVDKTATKRLIIGAEETINMRPSLDILTIYVSPWLYRDLHEIYRESQAISLREKIKFGDYEFANFYRIYDDRTWYCKDV